jgi:plastocyanin
MRFSRSSALLAAFMLAGCAGGTATDGDAADERSVPAEETETAEEGGPGEEAAAETVIDIVDFTFEPETLEVANGTTVEWVQQDSSRHTVDFDDGEKSGDLEEGDTYRRTFDEAGTYDYVCFFHPRMTASVTVTE